MECVPLDGQTGHLLIGHLLAGRIAALVQFGLNRQAAPGGRCPDQVHYHLTTDQGPAPPVLRDMTEHPMFDLVPLARAGREVTHRHRQAEPIGQILQFVLPQSTPAAVGNRRRRL